MQASWIRNGSETQPEAWGAPGSCGHGPLGCESGDRCCLTLPRGHGSESTLCAGEDTSRAGCTDPALKSHAIFQGPARHGASRTRCWMKRWCHHREGTPNWACGTVTTVKPWGLGGWEGQQNRENGHEREKTKTCYSRCICKLESWAHSKNKDWPREPST